MMSESEGMIVETGSHVECRWPGTSHEYRSEKSRGIIIDNDVVNLNRFNWDILKLSFKNINLYNEQGN